jgi:hypothetical protein
VLCQNLHQAKNAYPAAVIPLRPSEDVRIDPDAEGYGLIKRKKLDVRRDPKGNPRAMRPLYWGSFYNGKITKWAVSARFHGNLLEFEVYLKPAERWLQG